MTTEPIAGGILLCLSFLFFLLPIPVLSPLLYSSSPILLSYYLGHWPPQALLNSACDAKGFKPHLS